MNPDELKSLYQTLKRIDFFADLSVHEMDLLIGALKTEAAGAGKTVVKQGKVGDCLYIISEGTVGVWIGTGLFSSRRTAGLKEGEYFGEMALLDDQRRKATVKAETACKFLVLHRRDFWDIIMKNPAIEEKINVISKKRRLDNEKGRNDGK